MIVNDDTVSKALQYLAIDPHPIAVARHALTKAETAVDEVFARLFLQADGAIETRKQMAIADSLYGSEKDNAAEALLELERHKARVKAAEMIIEIWRTDNANARAAEKVR